MNTRLWDRCIYNSGHDAAQFIDEYFDDKDRTALLICAAGFDPRSAMLGECLSKVMGDRLHGFFIREERPNPKSELFKRACANEARLAKMIPNSNGETIEIFANDNAVIGGRTVVGEVAKIDLTGVTDVVVDTSALSLGVFFPLVKYLCKKFPRGSDTINLHLMVVNQPVIDQKIIGIASDRVTHIHGFRGPLGLDSAEQAAKLWLPLLIRGQRSVLERIHSNIQPDDVCPILPFPASNPRLCDELIDYYAPELESAWEVDPRNLVYADENNPLDVYRTTLRIHETRKRVFSEVGGALTILSPIGSKVLAIGSLMAAIECDFPVVYIEAVDYEVDDITSIDAQCDSLGEIVHVWLSGNAYSTLGKMEGFKS